MNLPRLWHPWAAFRRARQTAQNAQLAKWAALEDEERSRNLAWRTVMLNEQIGVITTSWAATEIAIELAVRLVHDNGGSAVHFGLPSSLNARLWYLRHVTEQVGPIRTLRKDAIVLCEAVDQGKKNRGLFSSGHVWIDPDTFEVCITEYVLNNSEYDHKTRRLTYDNMADWTRSSIQVLTQCTKLGIQFAEYFGDVAISELFDKLATVGTGRYEPSQLDWVFANPLRRP